MIVIHFTSASFEWAVLYNSLPSYNAYPDIFLDNCFEIISNKVTC